ncbi:MAG: RNA polymerase sigma-70 factor (ECF subfamily) [Planctomycetota bacterium]|jgi:RNA polymerase sigma-70 factor (ECF subfamily)
MEETNDQQLLAAFRGGDAAAFGQLVDRHQASCLKLAAFLLGGRAEVEDTVQEVFLKLMQKPPTLPDGLDPDACRAALAAWLHRVTRNACMDVLRSESRRNRREKAVASTEATPGGQNAVDAADTRKAVERSLKRLPEDQREVLFLRLLADRSYREIAEMTGKKAGTVGWLISTGLRALSEDLEPLLGMRTSRAKGGSARPTLQALLQNL